MVALGILCVLLPCVVSVGVVTIVNRNIRSFDENSHESFLG